MTRKEFQECIEVEVYKNEKLDPLRKILFKYVKSETNAVYLFRKMQYAASKSDPLHSIQEKFLKRKLAWRYGILASASAVIGKGLRFPHPTSIVIGTHVVAGENLSLYQNTTLGGARTGDVRKANQPRLGDHVTLFANSMVLGNVTVGNHVTIGANSCLLESVPDHAVCVGSPAKCLHPKQEQIDLQQGNTLLDMI